MELKELKNIITVVESVEKNIKGWKSLRGRELAIIPTDSDYYSMFKKWKKESATNYDGEKEKAPSYIHGEKAAEVLDLLIKHQEDFMKPHKEKLAKILLIKD
jgi:hypothetical protein